MREIDDNILAYHIGHDSGIAYKEGDTYTAIQTERLRVKRYSNLTKNYPVAWKGNNTSILQAFQEYLQHKKYTIVMPVFAFYNWHLHPANVRAVVDSIHTRMGDAFIKGSTHHAYHAGAGFYSSPFDKAIVITTDGGGDGEYLTISYADRETGIEQLETIQRNLGGLYITGCSYCNEVQGGDLTWSGKGMGLVARGNKILPHLYDMLTKFYREKTQVNFRGSVAGTDQKVNFHDYARNIVGSKLIKDVEKELNLEGRYVTAGQYSYDIMLTTQKAFEDLFDEATEKWFNKYSDLPIVLSGGCALNVLNNERIKNKYKRPVFVPSCPCDTGLAIGSVLLKAAPKEQVHIHNIGPKMYDIETLDAFVKKRNATKVTDSEIVDLLQQGNIIGYAQGPIEVGPRALGFRSILCDPSYPEMKEKINKIKDREWWRPFAPACRKQDAEIYFDSINFDFMEFMSFAVKVKPEMADAIPAVVHVDGSARLQTVTKESNDKFYELLTQWNKITGKHVLLNTSLNSWGEPIANTIRQCMAILDDTDLDYMVIDNFLFSNQPK